MVKNVEKVDLLDKETKESLKEFYKEDLKKLEGLLGKNLSQWYTWNKVCYLAYDKLIQY